MPSSFEEQLKNLFKRFKKERLVKVDSRWLASTRSQLKTRIRETGVTAAPQHNSWNLFAIKPVAAALVIILIVLLAGGSTVMAAQDTTPGDTLYPVKLAGEKFSLIIATSPEAKARLYIRYADRRLGELEKLYAKEPGQAWQESAEAAALSADTARAVPLGRVDNIWEERLVQSISGHMAGTKEQLEYLQDKPEYADVALRFEEITERHRQRMEKMRQRMATSSAKILERARLMNELNRSRALKALEHAQTIFESQERSKLQKIHDIQQRINKRLEHLHKYDNFFNNSDNLPIRFYIETTAEGINAIHIEASDNSGGGGTNELRLDDTAGEEAQTNDKQPATGDGPRTYELEIDDDGVHLESEIEIEGEGDEDIETYIDINDGQVIIDTRTEASGGSINIKESTTINASSTQSIRINGEEIDVD